MVAEALKPAVPREVAIDEKNRRILLKVANEDLAIAIGRKGQNARLTSRLIGWRLDIEEFKTIASDPRAQALHGLASALGVELDLAGRLLAAGFTSTAAFEGVEAADLVDAGFTEEEAQDLIARVAHASS